MCYADAQVLLMLPLENIYIILLEKFRPNVTRRLVTLGRGWSPRASRLEGSYEFKLDLLVSEGFWDYRLIKGID